MNSNRLWKILLILLEKERESPGIQRTSLTQYVENHLSISDLREMVDMADTGVEILGKSWELGFITKGKFLAEYAILHDVKNNILVYIEGAEIREQVL